MNNTALKVERKKTLYNKKQVYYNLVGMRKSGSWKLRAVKKVFYYYQDTDGNALFFKQPANKIILVGG